MDTEYVRKQKDTKSTFTIEYMYLQKIIHVIFRSAAQRQDHQVRTQRV